MSMMAMSASQSSVFTFESTVHSSHVLRCLDKQRRQDTLCDVTVVAEGQSFRAHRSVLASCSEYFTHRISTLTQHGVVITLPQEVTAVGFEALLKFAYTSKLHFRKDNVLEIRNSASVLGFSDLDEACFDFLLPKFFSSSKASAPFPRKTCCRKTCKRRLSKGDGGKDSGDVLLDEKEVKPVARSPSQPEVSWVCKRSVNNTTGSQKSTSTPTPVPAEINNSFMRCPKYRKFQQACGQENCVTEKSLHNAVTVIRSECGLSCTPCPSRANNKDESETEFPGESASDSTKQDAGDPWKTEICDKKTEESLTGARERSGKAHVIMKDEREGRREEEMGHTAGFRCLDRSSVKAVSVGSSTVLGARSSGCEAVCPLRALAESYAITTSVGQEMCVMDIGEDKNTRDSGALEPASIHRKAEEQEEGESKGPDNAWKEKRDGGQSGAIEGEAPIMNNTGEKTTREEVENLAKPLGSDVVVSQESFHNPDVGCSSVKGSEWVQSTPLEWLKQVGLSSGISSCPFFQDLDRSKCLRKGTGLSECEGASLSGVSTPNSGEDGDSETETEGDSESYTRERARQVQLPFSVDWIVDLTRNDFQQLLKQQVLTPEQLEFVHDMRRRSKNRLAAQRCRKRKLDCIHNLQCEIHKLKTEREKLLMEKSQLCQLKLKTCHTLTALCQRVCNEANLHPEQLQVLAKYTSPDCPLASFFPQIDTLFLQSGLPVPEPESSLSASSVGLDNYMAAEKYSSTSTKDTVTGDGRHSL